MDIYEYAKLLNKSIGVRHYQDQGRFSASFDHCETKQHKNEGVLHGTYGNGKTPDEAIKDYAKQISGRYLIFNAGSDKRQEFQAPIFKT